MRAVIVTVDRLRRLIGVSVVLCVVASLSGCVAGGGQATSTATPSAITPSGSGVPSSTPRTTEPTATPSAVTAAPDVGTQLATVTGTGRLDAISGGIGFAVIDSVEIGDNDVSTLTAYDASGTKQATLKAPQFTGECGTADLLIPGLGPTLLTELVTQSPAAGTNPALSGRTLDAWDGLTGQHRWTAVIVAPQSENPTGCVGSIGDLDAFTRTGDGRWALASAKIVDLTTGATRDADTVTAVVGNFLVEPVGNPPSAYSLHDPATGSTSGSIRTSNSNRVGVYSVTPSALAAEGGVFITSAAVGPTSDGARLLALPSGELGVVAYGLPNGQQLWDNPTPDAILADAGGHLIAERTSGSDADALLSLDDKTGVQQWTLPRGSVCGITSRQMLLSVNDQLAVIDLASGKQVSHGPIPTAGVQDSVTHCTVMLAGGIGVTTISRADTGVTLTMTQVLTP